MKISLEFCPNKPEIKEPESPLEDLRRMINDATS
ncbi:KGK domain-containing protein [Anabaena sp. WFMT]